MAAIINVCRSGLTCQPSNTRLTREKHDSESILTSDILAPVPFWKAFKMQRAADPASLELSVGLGVHDDERRSFVAESPPTRNRRVPGSSIKKRARRGDTLGAVKIDRGALNS